MIIVRAEPQLKRIHVRMSGMLTVEEVTRFSREEQNAVREMGLKSGEFDLLIKAEGNFVQTQEVMNALGDLMLNSPLKARRIATVRDGVLTRMQTKRISKLRSAAEVFETLADAEAWLAE